MTEPTPLGPSNLETTAFVFPSFEEETLAFERGDYTYARISHPAVTQVEARMARLEGSPCALAFSSGMSAIATLLLALASGKKVLAQQDLYGGTRRLLEILSSHNIRVEILRDVESRQVPWTSDFALVLIEIPTNPLLRVPDLIRWSEYAAGCGALLVVDSTMATPLGVQPLQFGAHLVIHSATKYLGGYDSVTGGFICGSCSLLDPIKAWRTYLGTIMTPTQAVRIERGIQDLSVRFPRVCETALELAKMLADHPQVSRVLYPFETSHPDSEIARRILKAGGGVVSFELLGDIGRISRFVNSLKHIKIAATFGGIHSVITHPFTTSHRWVSSEERARLGITENLLRLSVGLEPVEVLHQDILSALAS
ncbi:MAG: trans-sulfuration enzyme family protein [bacterium JZ-2024 1]